MRQFGIDLKQGLKPELFHYLFHPNVALCRFI
jgi:hypothetical protein